MIERCFVAVFIPTVFQDAKRLKFRVGLGGRK